MNLTSHLQFDQKSEKTLKSVLKAFYSNFRIYQRHIRELSSRLADVSLCCLRMKTTTILRPVSTAVSFFFDRYDRLQKLRMVKYKGTYIEHYTKHSIWKLYTLSIKYFTLLQTRNIYSFMKNAYMYLQFPVQLNLVLHQIYSKRIRIAKYSLVSISQKKKIALTIEAKIASVNRPARSSCK